MLNSLIFIVMSCLLFNRIKSTEICALQKGCDLLNRKYIEAVESSNGI
jgi:hypothetical protein